MLPRPPRLYPGSSSIAPSWPRFLEGSCISAGARVLEWSRRVPELAATGALSSCDSPRARGACVQTPTAPCKSHHRIIPVRPFIALLSPCRPPHPAPVGRFPTLPLAQASSPTWSIARLEHELLHRGLQTRQELAFEFRSILRRGPLSSSHVLPRAASARALASSAQALDKVVGGFAEVRLRRSRVRRAPASSISWLAAFSGK